MRFRSMGSAMRRLTRVHLRCDNRRRRNGQAGLSTVLCLLRVCTGAPTLRAPGAEQRLRQKCRGTRFLSSINEPGRKVRRIGRVPGHLVCLSACAGTEHSERAIVRSMHPGVSSLSLVLHAERP